MTAVLKTIAGVPGGTAGRRPGTAREIALVAVFAVVAVLPLIAGDKFWTRKLFVIAVMSIVAVGLNLVLGYAGEYALGQVGIFAAGAYVTGVLTATYGWNAWAAMLAGVLAAALIGLVASVPGLRVGGWYFALTSLFIATVIPQTVKIIPKPTGGEFGLAGIDRPTVLGHALSTPALYALSLVLLGLSLLGLRNLTRSTWGLAFACLRRGDICLRSVGVSPTRVRLTIYLLAAVLAGVGGAVYPFLDGFISPDAFPLSLSILIIGATIIGGSDAVWAPVIGVAILQFVPEVSDRFDKYALLIYGLALVLGSLLLPRGLVVPLRRGASALLAAAARPGAGTGGGTGTGGVPAGGTGSADAAVARLTGAADPGAVLEVAGLGKAFGGNQAVADVSFTARPGQITAVIGANGCGKTTTLNLISGFYRADRGRVGVGGTPLEGRAPHRVVRERVSRTFQTPLLLPDRTVLENVMAGMLTRTPVGAATAILGLPAARRARAGFAADAADLLAFAGLAHLAGQEADTLSPGRQRLLEVARALAGSPAVLLLDEPAAGLVGAEVDELAALLRAVRGAGVAIVLVEHNMRLVMGLADHVVVLDTGTVIATGTPDEVRADAAVARSYLGRSRTEKGEGL
ncbi:MULTISPECIES: branched-chain amino acid ABC transporter ATP-binding protein/permease [Thermomonosporaceae]|uniref:branched-chain amino acid ABC transporter ATP-binding protein/permease n=1 Tax=Thermomonosporaceae TaxID=2012 RepID=UPI00255A7A85|nr:MULTISPECIES: branched-chain amino acid ABC transporter ATP-binding protein/permease [Thermomonosporaceae]MDL4775451.1 branched-chain amino acid ABC transporter ATP-binding protein/permease [Actinomadura xylanilytica]